MTVAGELDEDFIRSRDGPPRVDGLDDALTRERFGVDPAEARVGR